MTLDMWIALIVLAAAILLFITEWLRVDVVALGVVIALMLSNLLTTEEALAGFSNPAVLTIAALFVVGGAVMQTGLAGAIGERILTIAGTEPARLTAVIMLTVAAMSAFMSDTGTVAVLLPAISSLALSAGMSTSRLLIPLSYGALLGGATTLIGTPPNIIVSDLLRSQGLQPFGFFSYTPIGLILLAVGVLFMLLAGRHMLPDYKPKSDVQRVETPAELLDIYRLPEDLFRLRVRRSSTLVEQSIDQARLRQDYALTALKILRHPESDPDDQAVRPKDLQTITPNAETLIHSHDVLIVKGEASNVAHAAAVLNLGVQPAQAEDESALISQEAGIAEVLLPPRSSLVGKSLSELRFGSQYHLTVLGIHRPGMDSSLDLKTSELRFGDTLLVQGAWQNILALKKRRRDFVVMGEPEEMLAPPARSKAPLALLILLGMLVLIVTNLVSVAAASLLAALAMILVGCVSIDEAYEAVDWKSIVLVAGMLPMSTALEKVGLVNLAAQGLADTLGSASPLLVLAGLFLATSLFTQVLSNTATTVLIAPIALVSAQKLGVQPYALMMAVAIAASMAFATPVASPVNTLVMGSGHYRFIDYIKVGVPLILLALIASLLVLPLLWPFN
jgi:di/tricarboxylate transporter